MDLGDNSLHVLPPEIGALSNLRSLLINNNNLIELPKEIGELTELRQLHLVGNKLSSLPLEIGNLKQLTELYANSNNLSAIPWTICNLPNLRALNIRRNYLTELPNDLGNLQKLNSIDLSYNHFVSSSLALSVGNLFSLTKLFLGQNELSEFPEWVFNLENLEVLSLWSNKLDSLPSKICGLKNLKRLDLSHNLLTELPADVTQLSNLEELILRENKLSALPTDIGKLKKLTKLDLDHNSLSELPPSIGELDEIQWLYLNWNNITIVPPELQRLTHLKRLGLRFNNLEQLPPKCVLLWLKLGLVFSEDSNSDYRKKRAEFRGIELYGTTLRDQNINIFLSNDVKRIREYCEDLIQQEEQGNMRVCNEARIVFLGDGLAGKTKTIQRILGIDTDTAETYGVDFFHWQPEGTNFNFTIWDFGGQAILHPMHQCFLSNECLYVLVVRPRLKGKIEEISLTASSAHYWLQMLNSFAPKSSVLLAVNIDEGTSLDEKSNYGISMEELQHTFPNYFTVGSHLEVYCAMQKEGDRFDQLQKAIIDKAAALDSVKRELPLAAWKIKNTLETMNTPVIDSEKIADMFNEAGITDEESRDNYLNWFRNLGVCFWYEQTKSVLDPKWITLAVYGLSRQIDLHKEELQEEAKNKIWPKGYANQNGLIDHSRILALLSDETVLQRKEWSFAENYEDCHLPYLLSILRQYGISYSLGGGTEFFPALCPIEPGCGVRLHPETYEKRLELVREYELIPVSAIANMIVACGSMLDRENCFRKTFRVKDGSLLGVVDFDSPYTRKLTITVYSFDETIPGTLANKLRAIAEEAELGIKTDEYLFYEPNDTVRAKISIGVLESALESNWETLLVDNVYSGKGVMVRVADVSGVYVYSNLRDIANVLISMLYDLGEDKKDFRNDILSELRKHEGLDLAPVENKQGNEFFSTLGSSIGINLLSNAIYDGSLKEGLIALAKKYSPFAVRFIRLLFG